VLGAAAAGGAAARRLPGLGLVLLAVTGLFLGRDSVLAWLRARDRRQAAAREGRAAAWQLGGAGACTLLLLVLFRPPWALVPLGLFGALVLGVHLVQMRRREARTVGGEILAILGLTATAPAAHLVATGSWNRGALGLWALAALFFASSVFHVKTRVLGMQARKAEAHGAMRAASAAYHVLLAAGLTVLVALQLLHPLGLAGFLPVVLRALVAVVRPARRVDLVRAGVLEIVYSIVFLVCVALAWRST
jgi:hypothetical protein